MGSERRGFSWGPLRIGPWDIWVFTWSMGWHRIRQGKSPAGWWYGRFRKRYKGVYNPRRWGFMVLGFEFGRRG